MMSVGEWLQQQTNTMNLGNIQSAIKKIKLRINKVGEYYEPEEALQLLNLFKEWEKQYGPKLRTAQMDIRKKRIQQLESELKEAREELEKFDGPFDTGFSVTTNHVFSEPESKPEKGQHSRQATFSGREEFQSLLKQNMETADQIARAKGCSVDTVNRFARDNGIAKVGAKCKRRFLTDEQDNNETFNKWKAEKEKEATPKPTVSDGGVSTATPNGGSTLDEMEKKLGLKPLTPTVEVHPTPTQEQLDEPRTTEEEDYFETVFKE